MLKEAEVDSYVIDADVLLMHVLGVDKNVLLMESDRVISDTDAERFWVFVKKRLGKMPVQYIVGKCEFMSMEFVVDENVLIPRPDTEILVETVLSKEKSGMKGLEIGIGSGCISVALAHHGGINMMGVDISPKAVDIARQNASKWRQNCNFIVSDMFANVSHRTLFDFVVSNPPYIPTADIEQLGENVKSHEPRNALDGGPDGLRFYRDICRDVTEYMTPGGRIYFEIGYDQGHAVKHILCMAGFSDINIIKDLAGHDRVIHGTCS
ncbi:MAG: peptide chain release factor N(5)-glutamine methyltransferase [Defluviitaleaceae bacterium]|nr:peptide chain release factor N(5)-glutamine methyltransferase [Defluviitaleaceae bacterium]